MWPRQIKMANDKMIIHSMARRLLMLLVRLQRRHGAVILIHNLSVTLWWAIYDLSLCILYINVYASLSSARACAYSNNVEVNFYYGSTENGGKARNSCYFCCITNKWAQLQPTVKSSWDILHRIDCPCAALQLRAADACRTQNKRKSFQLKIQRWEN